MIGLGLFFGIIILVIMLVGGVEERVSGKRRYQDWEPTTDTMNMRRDKRGEGDPDAVYKLGTSPIGKSCPVCSSNNTEKTNRHSMGDYRCKWCGTSWNFENGRSVNYMPTNLIIYQGSVRADQPTFDIDASYEGEYEDLCKMCWSRNIDRSEGLLCDRDSTVKPILTPAIARCRWCGALYYEGLEGRWLPAYKGDPERIKEKSPWLCP